MPFLEDLILGKPGSDRRRRYTKDSSLTGNGRGETGLEGFGAFSLLRPRRDAAATPAANNLLADEASANELPTNERKVCGSVACSNMWTAPWKSRQRPIFEGQWACSSRCLAAMIKAALTREVGEGGDEDGPEPHHHRIPLGLVMLAQGWITHPQLQKALQAQRTHGTGRIGEWLISECGIKPERVVRGLGVQWNCPVLSTESFWPEAMALALPRVFLEEYGVMPLRLAGRKLLYLGFQDCLDASAAFALEQMTGLKTESGVLPESEFSKARETLLRCEFPPLMIAAAGDRDGLARALAETIEVEKPEASRLVRLHRYYWLRVWAKRENSRRGGDLPEGVENVKDYLFTIGSRVPRWGQEDRSRIPSAELVEADLVEEEPMVHAGEETVTDRDIAIEPMGHTLRDSRAEAVIDATDDQGVFAAAEEELSDGLSGARAGERLQSKSESGLARVAGEAAMVTDPHAETESLLERHFLVKVGLQRGDDRSMQSVESHELGQIVESLKTERYLQRKFREELETIEGEYLTAGESRKTVLTIFDSSVPNFEGQPTGLNRLGRLMRLKPSFGYRESAPESGPDRAI